MADRTPPRRVTTRTVAPRIVIRPGGGGLDETPQFEGPDPRIPSARRSQRLSSGTAARERTVHGANGARPVHLGGPTPSGGYITFWRRTTSRIYAFFTVGHGHIWGYGAIGNFKFGDRKVGSGINVTTQTFLGAAGVTTSTLIQEVEPAFTFPEGDVGVAARFDWPNQASGEYDPGDFKCTVTQGLLTPNCDTGVVGFSRNVPRNARALLIMAGMDPATDLITQDWIDAQTTAEEDLTLGMAAATPAPTLAVAPTGAGGSVENGEYQTAYTWVTSGVESKMSPWSNSISFVGGETVRKLRTTGIVAGPGGTTARKLYRRKRNQGDDSWGSVKFAGTIADNVTTQNDHQDSTSSMADGTALESGSVPRWQCSGRIDTQALLQDQVEHVLDHCGGHLRHANGKWGVWMDSPKAVAVDGSAVPIRFKDFGEDANMVAEFAFTEKGRGEIPTVVTIDFPNAASDFVDDSVSIPEAGLPPGTDWIERRFSLPLCTERQQALRSGRLIYALLTTCTRPISGTSWMDGLIPLVGERCLLESRLLLPATVNIGNVGSVNGVEEAILVGKVERDTQVALQFSQYRETVYDDDITNDGSPFPPSDEDQVPDAPTGLTLTDEISFVNGAPVPRIKIEWTPADEPYSSFTRITYSYDGSTFYELGTGFQIGPAYLDAVLLGVQHTFKLYTVRTSTGQISAALTGAITPDAIDPTVPDVTQGTITAVGYLEFHPPVGGAISRAHQRPTVDPVVVAGAGGVTPTGSYGVRYAWVFASGESFWSEKVNVILTPGNQRIDITITQGPAETLYNKFYITNTNNPGGPIYRQAESAPASLSISFNATPSTTAELLAPGEYDYVDHVVVVDNFGAPTDPTIFAYVPIASPPQKFNRLDCRAIAHPDPTTGIPRIDVIVYVVNRLGFRSVGKSYSNTGVALPEIIFETATSIGAAGGASALPATPLGYMKTKVGGTTVKIPYYNN